MLVITFEHVYCHCSFGSKLLSPSPDNSLSNTIGEQSGSLIATFDKASSPVFVTLKKYVTLVPERTSVALAVFKRVIAG